MKFYTLASYCLLQRPEQLSPSHPVLPQGEFRTQHSALFLDGKMAQQLRTDAAFAQDLSLVSSAHNEWLTTIWDTSSRNLTPLAFAAPVNAETTRGILLIGLFPMDCSTCFLTYSMTTDQR